MKFDSKTSSKRVPRQLTPGLNELHCSLSFGGISIDIV
jgi:hypothetical protein